MNRLRDERGQVIVLGAVMIPVFLLLTALVVDVGNWYTHKRQLQNRADAAAFAAGVEYAKNWKACVQTADPALKASTAQEIADAARQYAGDPEATDYAGDALLPAHAREHARSRTRRSSTSRSTRRRTTTTTPTTPTTTTAAREPAETRATTTTRPARQHLAGRRTVDGRQGQGARPAVALRRHRAAALAQRRARARRDPAGDQRHRFLPLAVPNNVITKVQVRYYNECTDAPQTLLATRGPRAAPDRRPGRASRRRAAATLWGLPSGGDPTVGDPSQSFGLTLPSYGGCGRLPAGRRSRCGSRAATRSISTRSCAQLVAIKFADCFTRLSQIRVWNDGNADNQARLDERPPDRRLRRAGRRVLRTLPIGATNCQYDVSAEVDWGTRRRPPQQRPRELHREANGVAR